MWLSVTNGKVQYIAAQDGFKDAIAYLNRLYSEGLIDPEVFTLDWSSFPARTNPPLTDPEIVGVAPHWSRAGAFAPERADHYPLLLPLKGPKGYQFWRQNPESVKGGKYALEITRSCKNPEIAFRWADAVYDEIIGLNLYYGSTIVEKHNDGTYTITPSPISGEEWASWTDALNDRSPAYISDRFNSFVPDFDSTTLYPQIADKEKLSPYFPKEYFPPVSFTPDDVSELSILRTDIHSYAQEQAATWVVNGGVEKEYDAFVRQLETMGLRRMEEIYQAAYDRYMGK
jgi:putative aldouronate transport system substrate-binding protein